RNEIEEVDGGVAIGGAGDHVEHCEEDRVSVPVEAKELLVKEEDSDVGRYQDAMIRAVDTVGEK
ncbi:hypothetical protein FCV25MIE_17288, partial [Fagus crenata]